MQANSTKALGALIGGAFVVILGGVFVATTCDPEIPSESADVVDSTPDGSAPDGQGSEAGDLADALHTSGDVPAEDPAEEEPEEMAIVPAALQILGTDWELDWDRISVDEDLGKLVQEEANGHRVVLTLEPALQAHLTTVVHRYDEPAEAVVGIEPATGRVLVWVGDTSELSPVPDPLLSSVPYAASLFKVVSAAALLDEGSLDSSRDYCIPPGHGEFELEDLEGNREADTRCVDMTQAMAQSANLYFARQIDRRISRELLAHWLTQFGFNRPIPFEVAVPPSEAEVPDDRLERARLGAGFRHSHISPLHGALISASIANHGRMMVPTIVDQVLDANGRVLFENEPVLWREALSAEVAAQLTQIMSETTRSGTARTYFAERTGWPADLRVAGKTGTMSNRSEDEPSPDQLLIYSWFSGFAPIEEPTFAVAGVVYNTERWYIKGAYLASEAIFRHHRGN